jgi:hypothetical protein
MTSSDMVKKMEEPTALAMVRESGGGVCLVDGLGGVESASMESATYGTLILSVAAERQWKGVKVRNRSGVSASNGRPGRSRRAATDPETH